MEARSHFAGDYTKAQPNANRKETAMAPNQRALTNHDELFRGHVSTLTVTVPELIEI
jgi:hypothetical protein